MKEQLLKQLPSITDLLANERAVEWLKAYPRQLVTDCLRDAVDELRKQVLADTGGRCGAAHTSPQYILEQAGKLLEDRTQFHLRGAINATGIILHTGLGRSVLPECVAESIAADLRGYVTLAVDRETGERSDRDRRVEYILRELTGAEAATVVNNNAAATVLVLCALGAGRETIISRGELIEIGGAFRLPDVMAQSGTTMVEIGTTNRTHLRDYERAITEKTGVVLRVHPSNYRVVGFASRPELKELVELAHARNLPLVDDLGAGALVGLEQFGLPHEPTVGESISAGADVALFSADKLIGASQGGIIVGRKELIARIRKHPLARAFRVDKTCLMAIERTLHLFRDPARLAERHPLYRMLATPLETLQARAWKLADALAEAKLPLKVAVERGVGYLGSGSLPMHELHTMTVTLASEKLSASELARRLRTDQGAVFTRIENDQVVLDMRPVGQEQIGEIAEAVGRVMQPAAI